MLLRGCWSKLSARFYSTNPPKYILENLKCRTLIRVSGNEVDTFLQGLITNDINHLSQGNGSMYAMFLNTKGRVLYDTIIYKHSDPNTFLLECDVEVVDSLQKHLKLFRVKKKIDVSSLLNDFTIYAVFNYGDTHEVSDKKHALFVDGQIVPCNALSETQPKTSNHAHSFKDLMLYKDPRISALGSRIIAPKNTDVKEQLKQAFNIEVGDTSAGRNYRWFRYIIGVGEGVIDLPPSNCFPLESNCDYLHGVSFHKGCYIGQELTARTYHTGVVRKRLMPLILECPLKQEPTDVNIVHENLKLGKFRGSEGTAGLALLRIAQAVGKDFKLDTVQAKTIKPNWWPLEAPKEKISI